MSYSIHNDATQWVRTHNDTGETNTAPDSSIPPETGWSVGSGAPVDPELVTEGGFDNGGAAWSVNGLATTSTGVGRILTDTEGSYAAINQFLVMTIGTNYILTYKITDSTAGELRGAFGASIGATESVVGSHTITFTATSTSIGFKREGVTDISIDNISVREVVATAAPTLSYGDSPWVSGGEFTKLGYTDLLAHISGTGGVYFQWKPDGSGDACHLGPTITYDAFQAVTPSQYAQLKRWCERYTDTCGAGIADFGDL